MNPFNHIPEKVIFSYKLDKGKTNIYNNLKPEEKELIDSVKNFIEKNSFRWKIDNNFQFIIPPSIFEFPTIIEIPNDFQHKSNKTEYSPQIKLGTKFSPKILKQIWENGRFDVESKQADLPYTWQLSKMTVKGQNNIIAIFYKIITNSFNLVYSTKNHFKINNYNYSFPVTFLSSFYHLYITVYDLLNLLVGMPMYSSNYYELDHKIRHDYSLKFINLHPNINYNLFENEYMKQIKKVDNNFLAKWNNVILPKKMKIYKEQKLDESTIKVNMKNDEKIEFMKFLNESRDFQNFKKIFPYIEEFLYAYQIIIDEKFNMNEEYKRKMEDFKKEIEKHTIKKLCTLWSEEKRNLFETNLKKEQDQKLTKIIKEKIKNYKLPSIIYSYNQECKEQIPEKIEEAKKKSKKPMYEFAATRQIIRPYEIKRRVGQDGRTYYYVDKVKYYYVKTNFFFWRVWLFLIKLFCTFFNYNVKTYRFMTSSSLGIKALFYTELYSNIDVNMTTGAFYEYSRSYTFPRAISNLMTMICDSRKKFENAPDTGILGKGISRIFNLIINYVFRLLILGSILVCVYPLLIVANVIICSWLILFSPIVAPIWNLLDYLFSMLIFNRYDRFFFQLFRILVGDLIYNSIFQFIFCLICIVFKQVIALIALLLVHIYYILRTIYDLFFYYLLKLFGKIPLTDNFISWRIAGPHLFRERYYDISNKDLMSLVIAEIEKMVMNNYDKKMREILDSPITHFNNSIKNIFSIINVDIYLSDEITKSITFYKKILEKQINLAKKNYPHLSEPQKIKFSKEKLNIVKNLIESYLISYTSKNDLSFKLDKYEDNKIEHLTKDILKTIFGYRILETLDDADKIVHLESVYQNSLDEISQRLFENPRFDDRLFIEERKVEEKKVINLPENVYFKDVFSYNSPLNLNLTLDQKERDKLLNKKN